MKLNVRAFALTCGIFWGTALFIGTWWLLLRGDLAGQETFIGMIYPYYRVTPLGSILGLLYGAVDGFFMGLFFAWLYNVLAGKNGGKGE